MISTNDIVVQYTNMEATQCKYTLMKKRYLDDPYLNIFINPNQDLFNNTKSNEEITNKLSHLSNLTLKSDSQEENESLINQTPNLFRNNSLNQNHQRDTSHFVSRNIGVDSGRDPNILEMNPLLLRGYWSRVWGIWQVIQNFLKCYSNYPFELGNENENQSLNTSQFTNNNTFKYQILNLGAGFDTMRWKLSNTSYGDKVKIVELDFGNVTTLKKNIILGNSTLKSTIGEIEEIYENGLRTKNYVLQSCDLRNIESFVNILKTHLDPNIPTVAISEVALIYLESEYSDAIIKSIANYFKTSRFILYEQIKPFDSFGKVMVEKLIERGCPLLSIEKYPTIQAEEQRFIDLGYKSSLGCDMIEIYNYCVDRVEKSRIERLHMFDEFEEWQLLQSHYIFLISENGTYQYEDEKPSPFPKPKLIKYFR